MPRVVRASVTAWVCHPVVPQPIATEYCQVDADPSTVITLSPRDLREMNQPGEEDDISEVQVLPSTD